jgi:hypothetical protein
VSSCLRGKNLLVGRAGDVVREILVKPTIIAGFSWSRGASPEFF